MEIHQGPIILELTPAEARSLYKALLELQRFMNKYPNERNGFDIQSQITAEDINTQLTNFLNPANT